MTEVEAPDKVVPPELIRVKPPPLAGAAHFKPVGETELSATKWGMFLEQSLRIVLLAELQPIRDRL